MDWREEFEKELARGEEARLRGNEGRARVCARRAAGIAAREYFSRRRASIRNPNSLDLLHQLQADPALGHELKALLEHLTARVDEEFRLPAEIDLLADARQLGRRLFVVSSSDPGAHP